MKEIIVIKNRSDLGAGTRGSDLGIDAIEIAAINQDNDFFNLYEYEDIKTENEKIYNKVDNLFAKRIENIYNVCSRLSDSVTKNLKKNKFPIVLSGDHSSALGTISGIKSTYPQKTLGVVWIDAHADIHSPYTTPSGNVHGMPLAAALADDHLMFKTNDVPQKTVELWEKIKNIGVKERKIEPENIVYFGVRDTEPAEDNILSTNTIKNYSVAEMRYRGFEQCLQEAVKRLDQCDIIYISFDVDSMDCDLVSRGTGTPVSKGFDIDEVKSIIDAFIQTKKIACFEIVEVNPTLDNKGNKIAEAAFEVLNSTTKNIEKIIGKKEEMHSY
ncbi:arginase [Aquimarina algicola]|uniref:Arginase n=1 Tax=Aquimarina algicola TaxID=2589995 RepID=A0A504IY84_9FLAO|nr:arginase [Aquimarina algicola]TPN81285.1 arginase [Aquimarina algicola]